ncbi:MAG: hypothetical protein CV087_08605 [Candidatus Brocadia sp. WS118]|nr:MAG: hypothetical protein CV087_08605 [Candidatus Brocadia sp. WS118]
MGKIKFCVAISLLSLMLYGPIPVTAQESTCDPDLKVSTNHPFRYAPRGNRCEGIYIQEVSSATLSIISFTKYFEDYDLESSEDLRIEWEAPEKTIIKLRAQGIKPRLYYRMDTQLPPDSDQYIWPTNILSAMDIHKDDIGVVGWTDLMFGQKEQNVFIPLHISQQHQQVDSTSYRLVIVPGRELNEVFISLALVDSGGKPASFLKDGEPLEYGFYPAGRGVTIPISNLQKPGIYYLEIGAALRGGGSATVEMLFDHAK